MTAWRVRMAIVAAPLVAACAAVLNIDDLPLAPPPPAVNAPDASDTPDACDSDASFCARTCPAFEFCDDFERETDKLERWKTAPVIPNPFKTGVFASSLGIVEGPPDRGLVLRAHAESSTDAPQTLLLIDALPPAPPGKTIRGVHARMRGQLAEFTFPADRTISRTVGVFGLGATSLPIHGTTLSFYDRGDLISVGIEQRTLGTVGGTDSLDQLLHVDGIPRASVVGQWVDVEFIVGVKPVLAAHGFACNPVDGVDGGDGGVSDDAVVLLLRAFGIDRCVPLINELGSPDWLATPVVSAGLYVTDFGVATYLFDDVGVRYLY